MSVRCYQHHQHAGFALDPGQGPQSLKWFISSAVAELHLHGPASPSTPSSNASRTEQGYAENVLPPSVIKTTGMFDFSTTES